MVCEPPERRPVEPEVEPDESESDSPADEPDSPLGAWVVTGAV